MSPFEDVAADFLDVLNVVRAAKLDWDTDGGNEIRITNAAVSELILDIESHQDREKDFLRVPTGQGDVELGDDGWPQSIEQQLHSVARALAGAAPALLAFALRRRCHGRKLLARGARSLGRELSGAA